MERRQRNLILHPSYTIFYNFLRSQQKQSKCIHPDGKSIKKEGKKGNAASRVSLVKTVGPFFFGLIFSGPFVTWSVKDLVSHQFGTSSLA